MKAISEKSSMLIAMIIFRARFTALTGYGIGVGLYTALIGVAKLRLPSYAVVINFWNLGIGLVIVLLIVAVSSHISVRRGLRNEPFDIFRG